MKLWLKVVVMLALSLLMGLGSAYLAIRSVGRRSAVQNGAWAANLAVGSREAGMYTRAATAVGGLFALSSKETIYYTAFVDDDGEPLRAECDYVLEGKDLAARWWSFTVYGEDHFLIPNPDHRYSTNLLNVERQPDRGYQVHLSSRHRHGNWLPTGNQGEFSITLRLYNPAKSVYEQPGRAELPKIRREGCR